MIGALLGTGNVLAGIAFDPTIRGLLAVAVGVVVLMGSVYLLLATNTGNRLGFLLAAAGFFGWMMIMGLVWWIYGIGMLGQAPSWEVVEYNAANTDDAVTDVVTELDLSAIPRDPDGEPDHILLNTIRADDARRLYELAGTRNQTVADLLAVFPVEVPDVPRGLDPFGDEGDLATVRELLDPLHDPLLEAFPGNLGGDWEFLDPSNPKRGEAEATVSANLPECATCNFGISAPADYIVIDAFRTGGKPARPADANLLERAVHKVTSTLRLTHPEHYAVVQVRKVIPQQAEPGQAPPLPVADLDEPVISVVMLRDIGDRRFPAAMITIGSALIFFLLCWMLHQRERVLEENLAAAEAPREA